MNDICKIALLWLIREHKPINLQEITNMLEESPHILPSHVGNELLRNLRYHPKHAVEDLLKAGLITTLNGSDFNVSIQLTTESRLPIIQSLFEISLTESLKERRKYIRAYPIFGEPRDIAKKQKWAQIFVAMPFQDELRTVYTDHILKITNELDISCKRGDDFFSANSVINDVWSAIFHAELCIVDCTGRNPNVFYELGIAHTLGRPAILIAQDISDIPFDVRHLRIIIYQLTPQAMTEFAATLKRTIEAEML